jgi:hypothetical protein
MKKSFKKIEIKVEEDQLNIHKRIIVDYKITSA